MKYYLYKQKRKIIKKAVYIRFLIKTYFNTCSNSILRQQLKNPKEIPIIIISFNQLNYLRKLIDFLKEKNYSNIVILDNNSTYKPLLEYFETIKDSVKLHLLNENYGHLVFWKNKELFNKYSKGYYVVTDADIVPDEFCPEDFILHFRRILNRNNNITKVGFSLKIDDLPDCNPNKWKIIKWEEKYWKKINKNGDYLAELDTTFALYRPNYQYAEKGFLSAIRTNKPYQVRHGGWYLNAENLSEEQVYYFETCNESSAWRIDNKGNLKNKELF